MSLLINYLSFARNLCNNFDTKIENISLRGEGRRGNGALS